MHWIEAIYYTSWKNIHVLTQFSSCTIVSFVKFGQFFIIQVSICKKEYVQMEIVKTFKLSNCESLAGKTGNSYIYTHVIRIIIYKHKSEQLIELYINSLAIYVGQLIQDHEIN